MMNNLLRVIFLFVLFTACHSMTERKALDYQQKNADDAPIARSYYEKKSYPDGSIGYSASFGGIPLYNTFKNGVYILEKAHHRAKIAYDCTPVPNYESMIGYHKAGKCAGKWYTFTEHHIRITPSCRDAYRMYIPSEDNYKDTTYTKFYRLHQLETYKNGFLDGDFICYDINHSLLYKTKFRSGTGYYKHFYPHDNRIQEEGAYLNGFKEGKWILYWGAFEERDTFVRFYNKGVEIK